MPYTKFMDVNGMPMHQGRSLPQFSLREIDLPNLKKWQEGQEYFLVVKVKMVGRNLVEEYQVVDKNDAGKLEGNFKVLAVKALESETDVQKMSSKEFELHTAKILSGEYK
jgi:hypothetical protein